MKRARDVRDQLEGLMDRVEIEKTTNVQDHDAIRKTIAAGFFYHSAKLQKSGSYRTVKNSQTVDIHPSSGLAKAEVGAYLSPVLMTACKASIAVVTSPCTCKHQGP